VSKHIEIDQDDYERMREEIEQLRHENDDMAQALSWIRTKLGVPADAGMFTPNGIAGMLHVWDAGNNGYQRYITAYKCDDKQGEIARQSVKIADQEKQLASTRSTMHKIANESAKRLAENKDLLARNEILDGIRIASQERVDRQFAALKLCRDAFVGRSYYTDAETTAMQAVEECLK